MAQSNALLGQGIRRSLQNLLVEMGAAVQKRREIVSLKTIRQSHANGNLCDIINGTNALLRRLFHSRLDIENNINKSIQIFFLKIIYIFLSLTKKISFDSLAYAVNVLSHHLLADLRPAVPRVCRLRK